MISKIIKSTKITEDWRFFKLEEIISLEYGKGLPEKNRKAGSFPVFGSNGIIGFHSEYLVRGPGIIVGRKGTIGAVVWSNKNFWPIDTTYYIRLKRCDVDLKWIYYMLSALCLSNLNMATGTPGLNRDLVYKIKIPLPPLPEQRRIARVLGTVDSAIEKTDATIARTERLKRGLMQKLLTRGIGHKEFKDTEIGRIPAEWAVVRLGDVVEKAMNGGTPSTKIREYWNGDIPWIRSVNLTKYYLDENMIEKYITSKGVKNSATNIIPKDNVIVATRVGIGKSAVNLIDVAINQDLTGLIIDKKKADPLFIVWYLHSSKVQRYLESFSRGTTIKGVPQHNLRNLKLPLPPLPEQEKIAEILGTVDKKLELLRARRERLERVKKGLMSELLTGRKRVPAGVV